MSTNTERTVAWVSTIFTCLFVAWTAVTQPARIAPFESIFAGLGVALPTVTRTTLAASRTPFPLLLGALLVLVLLAKEFIIRNKWSATCFNLCAFIAVDGLSRFADYAMGVPMIDLIMKVK